MQTYELRVQHTSLQNPKDSPKQKEYDVQTLFEKSKSFPIKTGTEGGMDPLRSLLKEAASEYNHAIHFAADTWVAVDRRIIKPKTLVRGDVFVMDNDEMVGRGQDRRMAYLAWEHPDPRVGGLAQSSVHYPTKGQRPGDPNHWINKAYAEDVYAWMRVHGRGHDLAFTNGDFNMPDIKLDWAFGRDFTSMADELDAHQPTGHGPIDGMCSYNRDGRVKAKRFNVLNDRELFMNSDHYVCRGVWEITLLSSR